MLPAFVGLAVLVFAVFTLGIISAGNVARSRKRGRGPEGIYRHRIPHGLNDYEIDDAALAQAETGPGQRLARPVPGFARRETDKATVNATAAVGKL